jgi:hypothetical protein
MPSSIVVAAAVEGNEHLAVVRACEVLAASLKEASGGPWGVEARFFSTLREIPAGEQPAFLIASLSRDVPRADASLVEIETRWREELQALIAARPQPVFLCTVFRHVDPVPAAGAPTSIPVMRERICRLNLMAARLSQATGVNIVDVDRSLAQIGARNLGTDWRLAGADAEQITGHLMARILLADCPDEIVSFDIQELAKESAARRLATLRCGPGPIRAASAAHAYSLSHQVFVPQTGPLDYIRRGLIRDITADRFGVARTVSILTRNMAKLGHRNVAAILRRYASRRLRKLLPRETSAK